MTTDERDEAATKAFLFRGDVTHGYETRTDDEPGMIQLVRISQTDEGPVLHIIAIQPTEYLK